MSNSSRAARSQASYFVDDFKVQPSKVGEGGGSGVEGLRDGFFFNGSLHEISDGAGASNGSLKVSNQPLMRLRHVTVDGFSDETAHARFCRMMDPKSSVEDDEYGALARGRPFGGDLGEERRSTVHGHCMNGCDGVDGAKCRASEQMETPQTTGTIEKKA